MRAVLTFLSSSEAQKEKSKHQVFHSWGEWLLLTAHLGETEYLIYLSLPWISGMNPAVDRERGLLEKAPALFGAHLANSVCNPQDFNADPFYSILTDHQKCRYQEGCICLFAFVCFFTSCFEVVKFLVRYFPKLLV